MVSRKTTFVMIGAALLLGACRHKKDSPPAVQPDASNVSSSNAGMIEDIGNDSNATAANATTEAAPAKPGFKRGERSNPDTRGAPLGAAVKVGK